MEKEMEKEMFIGYIGYIYGHGVIFHFCFYFCIFNFCNCLGHCLLLVFQINLFFGIVIWGYYPPLLCIFLFSFTFFLVREHCGKGIGREEKIEQCFSISSDIRRFLPE